MILAGAFALANYAAPLLLFAVFRVGCGIHEVPSKGIGQNQKVHNTKQAGPSVTDNAAIETRTRFYVNVLLHTCLKHGIGAPHLGIDIFKVLLLGRLVQRRVVTARKQLQPQTSMKQ